MVASSEALRSRQPQAVSVSEPIRLEPQLGGHQSAGQPAQAEGRMVGGDEAGRDSPTTTTPEGSPGGALGGPAVAGGTSAGSLSLGVSGSGGRSDRVSQRGATLRAIVERSGRSATQLERGAAGEPDHDGDHHDRDHHQPGESPGPDCEPGEDRESDDLPEVASVLVSSLLLHRRPFQLKTWPGW